MIAGGVKTRLKNVVVPRGIMAFFLSVPLTLNAAGMLKQAGLTLDAAIEHALAISPELAAIAQGIGIAEGQYRQAGLYPNPEVSWYQEDFGKYGETTDLVSQEILLGGKRSARMNVAATGQSIAELQYRQRVNQLRADILEAFYTALLAQEQVRIAELSVTLAQKGLKVAQGQVRAGRSSPIEERRNQIQLSEVEIRLTRAKGAQLIAYRALAAYMGDVEPSFDFVQGDSEYLPPLPDTALLEASLPITLLMKLADLQIDQNRAQVDLERAKRIPNINVSLGYKRLEETNRDQVVVGLAMPLPLFNRNQGNIYSAEQRVNQSEDTQRATLVNLQNRTRQSMAQWQVYLQTAKTLNVSVIPSAEETLDKLTRGFRAGKFEMLDVLDAQRTLLALRSDYIDAVLKVAQARAEIERIYGAQPGATDY